LARLASENPSNHGGFVIWEGRKNLVRIYETDYWDDGNALHAYVRMGITLLLLCSLFGIVTSKTLSLSVAVDRSNLTGVGRAMVRDNVP
jgi:hypothetical protein